MSGFSVALSLSSSKFHIIEQDWLHIEVEDANLVLVLISLNGQMFLSMTKTALALPILAVTSLSMPPCHSTALPR